MTKALFKLFILFIACSTAISCSEQDSPELPDNPGNTDQGIASIDQNQINANGGGFIVRVKTNGEWQASSSETWCTLSRTSGNGNGSISGYVKANTGAERSVIITIISGKEKAEFTLKQLAGNGSNPDPDPDPDPEKPSGYAGRIEVPKLKGGSMNLFYTHVSNYNGKEFITYSAEYDCTKKHTRWVAFTFDNVSNQKNTNRSDKWGNDPNIPAAYRTYASDYSSPYNKGHLVASADRYITREANVQTFYYSNMSPQITSFNGGIWNQMEEKVRSWAKSLSASDTVYVVKGGKIDGTIADGTLIEYTGNQVAVPQNYFMAILSLKGGATPQYKAIAFYINQKTYSSSSISNYVISIDELEQKTGIDFFHNLPDNIENEVEQSYNKSDWGL